MEINKIHSDLKEIYKAKDIKGNLKFEFDVEDQKAKLMKLLKKGFWSVMPFAFHGHKGNDILAFQLIPGKKIEEAPIVSFDKVYQECFMLSPNIKAIISMVNLMYMDEESSVKRRQEAIEETIALSKPFF